MNFDWKKTLSSVAPALATALAGPMAGAATKFLSSSLLGDENADAKELENLVLGASPETLAKIKDLDYQFKSEMKKLDIDIFALEVDDRKNARELSKQNMWPQLILSAIFIGGYFSIIYLVGSTDFSIDGQTFGILTVSIPVIMQFWFGSSHGSKSKDAAK